MSLLLDSERMEYRGSTLFVGGCSAPELVTRFGSPLYVYDAAILRQQIDRITHALAILPFRPFYAMKANSNLALMRIVARHGFGFDAVSPGEVFLARNAGQRGESVWFTCSNVSDDDLKLIGDDEVVITVNAMSDIDRCIRLGLRNPIAIRVNPDIGAGHHRDVVTGGYGVKFGIDIAELREARLVAEDSGLRVVGLHAHIGSGIGSVQPLLDSARTLVALADEFASLQWLNFGGGIAVPYKPDEHEFPLDEYARGLEAIAGGYLRRRNLQAILEPGRFVVAQCGTLLATVTTKRVSSGFEWIGCDTGFNHLVRPSKYGSYHHILNASHGGNEWLRTSSEPTGGSEVIVAGNLCESGDVFTRDPEGLSPRRLPPAREGDVIAFCDVGAYGFSMASHYNARLLPAEILVDGDDAHLIRRRQTFDDLLLGLT